jgi:hypothetical protein
MARSTVLNKAPEHHATKARPTKSELLLFTARRPSWAIIGALSVMTMDWRDF